MLNLKKTAIAVLALSSSAVFAGTMGPVCTPGNVTIPCETSAWDFGVQALYLKTTYSNGFNNVGVSQSSVAPPSLANDTIQNIDPGYGWGFKLEGSYHFSTGNDLNLNWYHVNNSGNNNNDNVTLLSGFIVFGAPELTGVTAASFSTHPTWDAVNLEFGQYVNFSEMKSIRFHGGVQYARTTSDLDVTVSGIPAVSLAASTLAFDQESTFNGFGPRVGADMAYGFGNGFGVYANAATALLIGSTSYTTANVITTTATSVVTLNNLVSGSDSNLVPELEGKLGATYNFAMAQGNLGIDAGWMWVNYFSPLASVGFDTTGTEIGVADSTFGLNGPYIGLKWVGNV